MADSEQVAIVKYLILKDLSASEIHSELVNYRRGTAMSLNSVTSLVEDLQG